MTQQTSPKLAIDPIASPVATSNIASWVTVLPTVVGHSVFTPQGYLSRTNSFGAEVESQAWPTDLPASTERAVDKDAKIHADVLDSDTRSVTCIRTTWTSSTIAIDQLLPLIEDFVTVLVTDPRVGLLLKASLRDPTIGKARIRNNLRRLLVYLGSDLKFEVEG